MQRLIPFFCIILYFNISFAQNQKLQAYIEEGHGFHEIYQKADRMIRRHQLEDEPYRKEYRKGKKSKDWIDNERLHLERWAWYWRDRVADDGSFPDLQRQQILYQELQKGTQYRNVSVWKHEGPVRNTGGYWGMGRTTHIDFHPSQNGTFYVAAPNGGLWKTTDGGATYNSLGEQLPQQPVGVVIVDPRNANNIFISLGEKEGWWQYGLGVYKSTDGGQTWKTTGLSWKLTESKVLFSMVMNPRNSNVLLAATNNGLYKTYNGGNSWVKVLPDNFSDVIFKPGDTTTVYAAKNDYWGSCEVFKSNDGGSNWTQVSSFNTQKAFLKLAVTQADPNYLAVNASQDGAKKLFLSTNSGNSFSYMSDMPENLVFYISQQNPSLMYCGYVNPYQSRDGGRSWNQMSHWHGGTELPEVHADQHYLIAHPRIKSDLYFCNDGGVYRYNENTEQWTELVHGLPITQFYKMAVSNTNPPSLIGGSQDNGGFIRRSSGAWGNTNGGDAMWQEIDPTNANIGYTEYWGGTAVYRTNNNFFNLTEISINVPGDPQGQWVTPFGLNPKNPKTFIIAYHEVFVSHNRGDQFVKLSTNLTGAEDRDLRIVRFNPLDTQTILASYANTVYHTRDYGRNWSKTTVSLNNDVTDICFHSKDTNKVWLSRSGLGTIKIMESRDRGRTWTNATSNFVNTPVLALCYDEASNILFAGTDIGVFFSEAGNWNWQYYGTGLPNTSVTDLDIHQQTRKLYISTYGRGFYSIDLPDCSPLAVNIAAQNANGAFQLIDTMNFCVSQPIVIKCNENLNSGTFRWTGPLNLDTTMNQNPGLNLGSATLSKTGNYVLVYTSANGCTRTDQIYIKVNNNPSARIRNDYPVLDCKHDQLRLFSSNTSVDFSYIWTDSMKQVLSDSAVQMVTEPGWYFFKLSNKRTACSVSDSFYVKEFVSPKIEFSASNPKCFGDSTGSIRWNVLYGVPPLKYTYSDTMLFINPDRLPSGSYTIKVSDSLNCEAGLQVELQSPPALDVDAVIKHSNQNNGKIELNPKGGVAPYRFLWIKNGEEFSRDSNLFQIDSGLYTLFLTDSFGCEIIREFRILDASLSQYDPFDAIRIYPNPAVSEFSLDPRNMGNDGIHYELMDATGKVVMLRGAITGPFIHKINVAHLVPGNYLLRVFNKNSKRDFKIQIVNHK